MKKQQKESANYLSYVDAQEIAKLAAVRLRQVAGNSRVLQASKLVECLESAYAFYYLANRKNIRICDMPPSLIYTAFDYLKREFWGAFDFDLEDAGENASEEAEDAEEQKCRYR